MYASLIPSTATVCPLTTAFLRQHSRIDQDADDALITQYGIVATEMVENYLSRYLLTRTVTWTLSDAPMRAHGLSVIPWQWTTLVAPAIDLPRPATAVTSIKVGLWNASDITLVENTDYNIDYTGLVGRLRWISNNFLNASRSHIQITFTSGYGPDLTYVPVPIQHAITVLTTNLYENRGDDMPTIWHPAVEALLANYRFMYFS